MKINLRQEQNKKTKEEVKQIEDLLLNENPTKLTKDMIARLEWYVPLEIGIIFERNGYDGKDTRMKLLELLKNNKTSLKVIQLEIMRRKKMKVG